MKYNRVVNSHGLEEELPPEHLEMIDRAIVRRTAHLRSIDELDMRDVTPKKRKTCHKNKRKFRDKIEADQVLHHIINRRKDAESAGRDYRFKQFRSYKCGCGFWHHSSKPELGSLEALNVA
jgi:hypothetical protein